MLGTRLQYVQAFLGRAIASNQAPAGAAGTVGNQERAVLQQAASSIIEQACGCGGGPQVITKPHLFSNGRRRVAVEGLRQLRPLYSKREGKGQPGDDYNLVH